MSLTREEILRARDREIAPVLARIKRLSEISAELEEIYSKIREGGPEDDRVLDAIHAVDLAVNAAQVTADDIEAKYGKILAKFR